MTDNSIKMGEGATFQYLLMVKNIDMRFKESMEIIKPGDSMEGSQNA